MKEIRLRAFDTIHKKFVSIQKHFDFDSDGNLYQISIKLNDFVVMQYTGLKDKNGKKIFEGDIVKAVAKYSYKKESKTSDVIQQYSGQWSIRNQGSKHGLPITWGGWKTIEVIGNIYENSELLKEQV